MTEGTQVRSRKIQVRMPSGKIYGPYQRAEILAFIQARKIAGEESILIEGTQDWKPITSDPEFFDALKDSIFGATKVKAVPMDPKTLVTPETPPEDATRTRASVKAATQASAAAASPAEKKETPRAKSTGGRPIELEIPDLPQPLVGAPPPVTPMGPPSTATMNVPSSVPAVDKKIPAKHFRLILLVGVVAVLAALMLSNPSPKGGKGGDANPLAVPELPLLYGKHLSQIFVNSKLVLPEIPDEVKPMGAQETELFDGMDALSAMNELKRLTENADPAGRMAAAYWFRIAWDLRNIAAALEVWGGGLAKPWNSRAEAIESHLRTKKLLNKDAEASLDGAALLREGKWDEALTLLSKAPATPPVLWLLDEAAWWQFWDKGSSGNVPAMRATDAPAFEGDLIAQIRAGVFNKDAALLDKVDSLASVSPRSPLLWMVDAEYSWRMGQGQVSRANYRFLTGIAVASFWPRAQQRIFWKQYADFLRLFGRQSTADRAQANSEVLEKGSPKKESWWDFGQEGLDAERITKETLARSQSGSPSPLDIATLQVLGPVSPQGSEALAAAGDLFAFDGEWTRAVALYEATLAADKDSSRALEGLIWAQANLFHFDVAFDYYDRVAHTATDSPLPQRLNAAIHLAGREYDSAIDELNSYVKSVPNDAWGYYLLSLAYERMEKNVDCVRDSQLAYVHGVGEIKFRAVLQRLKCRIAAKMGTENALNELRALYQKNPRNLPVIMTLTEVLKDLDLIDEAVKVSGDSLRRLPYAAYVLRLRLGEIYEKKGDYDKAVAFYTSAAHERADSSEAKVKIGRVYLMQEKPLEAAMNFETAARTNPEYPEAWILAARAYAKGGKWREASDAYQREIELRPAVLGSFVEMAEFMLRINAPQEVPKIFLRYKESYEDDPRVLTRLAQAYLALKQYENARLAASTAIARNPSGAEPYRILAIVSELQGVYGTAREYYEKYLKIFPQAPDAGDIRYKISRPPFSQ